ncbi:MAG: thiamine pyrophosphate-dependent enzyme, partial [Nitrososphaeraceae archaeon]
FQMTGTELSTIAREKLNPIIILLNNDGYRTERTILDGPFNDLYSWDYSKIIELLKAGVSFDVHSNREFESALEKAKENGREFVLINVHLDRFDASAALKRLTESLSKIVR